MRMASLSSLFGGFLFILLLFITHASSPKVLHKHFRKTEEKYTYTTKYIAQPVDHFGFTSNLTYQQRYLVSDMYWSIDNGVIFFYTGNEGDISWFAQNTGLMWEMAHQYNAMLVFAEHRYYGKSMPFGKDSYKDASHVGYLTAEQALADFANLITYLKHSIPGAKESPVIAFGGSYGGMLSAWMRIKYPHLVDGALAASAPVLWFTGLINCMSFFEVVTGDFMSASLSCADNIRASWDVINQLGSNESGRKKLQDIFHLCAPLKSEKEVNDTKAWLYETWGNLAMVDYPYSASFLEPLPAWPIKEVCKHLSAEDLEGEDLLRAVAAGIGVYYNYTGSAQCYNISVQGSGDLGDQGWDYQACTEMVMPMCSDGDHDMFEPSPWNLEDYMAQCEATYKVTPRPYWIVTQFGGKDISASSNIIFSNGLLDPWSKGGVLKSLSESLVAIVIPEGAHHLDLRAANPDDPPSVIAAREKERAIIADWIRAKRFTDDISRVEPSDIWIETFSLQDEWHMRLMMGLGIIIGVTLLLLLLRASTHRRLHPRHAIKVDEMKKPLL